MFSPLLILTDWIFVSSPQYKATDLVIPGPGKLEMVFTPENGTENRITIFNFKAGGVGMGMYNTDQVSEILPAHGLFNILILSIIQCHKAKTLGLSYADHPHCFKQKLKKEKSS